MEILAMHLSEIQIRFSSSFSQILESKKISGIIRIKLNWIELNSHGEKIKASVYDLSHVSRKCANQIETVARWDFRPTFPKP